MQIQIFQIKVNHERREVDQETVHQLADSISKLGLLNPITVDQEYMLIAGLHRLEAVKLLGWTEIECTVSSLEGLLAQLAEIDENFVRTKLDAIDSGKLLLKRKEIYESLHPEVKNGGDRKSKKIRTRQARSDRSKGFTADSAEKLGISKWTVEENIQIAKDLTQETQKIIQAAEEKVKKKDMLKLSRLPPEQQEEAAHQLTAKEIHSVDEYHPVPADKVYSTVRESVEDLKNPDKDRSRTTDTFLASLSPFLEKFCQDIRTYIGGEYESVYPALTQGHLDQLRQSLCSVHAVLDNLFKEIERKSKNE